MGNITQLAEKEDLENVLNQLTKPFPILNYPQQSTEVQKAAKQRLDANQWYNSCYKK